MKNLQLNRHFECYLLKVTVLQVALEWTEEEVKGPQVEADELGAELQQQTSGDVDRSQQLGRVASVENRLHKKGDLKRKATKFQNKMKGLEDQEGKERGLEAALKQERVEKEKIEAMISKLEGKLRGIKLLKAEQEIGPPDVTQKIHELQRSLVLQRNDSKMSEEKLSDLRQQETNLQETLHMTWKMYEDVENKINEMKTKIPRERCNKPQDSKA